LPHNIDIGAIQDDLHDASVDIFTLRAGVRRVTTAGAQSQNQLLDYALTLEYGVGDISAPNAPTIDTFEILQGGYVRLLVDHDQESGLSRGEYLIATCNGESVTEYLPDTVDVTQTEFIFTVPIAWGVTAAVSITAYDALDRASTAATDSEAAIWEYEGGYGTIANAILTTTTPAYADIVTSETFSNSINVVTVKTAVGYTAITSNGVLIFEARIFPNNRLRIFSEMVLHGIDVLGSIGSSSVLLCSSPPASLFYLRAGSRTVVHVDPTAYSGGDKYIRCNRFDIGALDCPLPGPYAEYEGVTYWQVFDISTNRWRPFMAVDSVQNCLHFVQPVEFS
jgi:hypothetical protein